MTLPFHFSQNTLGDVGGKAPHIGRIAQRFETSNKEMPHETS
jgi:hypothetical protein